LALGPVRQRPLSAVAFAGAFALLRRERIRARLASFDAFGAILVTGGMLLLVYALVKAPDVGWGSTRTVAELAGAAAILVAFVANELRVADPLIPLSILRVRGVAFADATQLVAVGGFVPLRTGHDTLAQAATQGYGRALLAGAGIVLAGGAVAVLAPNTRQTAPAFEEEPQLDLAA
jgi:hypothetical protein